MNNDRIYKPFIITLFEALNVIIKDSLNAQKKYKNDYEKGIEEGYLLCFHRIITLIEQHAEIYNISMSELNLSDIKEEDIINKLVCNSLAISEFKL